MPSTPRSSSGFASPNLREHFADIGIYLEHIQEQRYFTVVYYARDRRGAALAVKLVHHPSSAIRRKFGREIQVLESISEHPGFPHVRAHGMFQQQPYVATEWIKGPSVKDLLSGDGLIQDPAESLRWVRDAAALVEFLHDNRIVHRDVASDHVFVSPTSRRIRLIDFGMAEWLDLQHASSAHRYLQYDVLALGLLLVELLVGKLLFDYRQPALQEQVPHAIIQVRSRRFPHGIQDLIHRSLSADSEMDLAFQKPARAYESVCSFRRDLDRVLRALQ